MPNYQNGKIYCLRSYQTDDIYIGSTTQPLNERLSKHRFDFKKQRHRVTSFEILKYDDCYIELIKTCPCDTKEELLRHEGERIRSIKCVNKNIAGRTDKEYRDDNKEKLLKQKKEYYENNRTELLKKKKEYAKKNNLGVVRKQYMKEYNEKNNEKLLKQKKENYEKNKEKYNDYEKKRYQDPKRRAQLKARAELKYTCEVCNKELSLIKKNRHEKTKTHLDILNNVKPEPLPKTHEECECGGRYLKHIRKNHLKTKKHKEWAENKKA
jgi:hypothetical protein